jgi:hypothetical protein
MLHSIEEACAVIQKRRALLAHLVEATEQQKEHMQPHFVSTWLIEEVLMDYLPAELQQDMEALLIFLHEQFGPTWSQVELLPGQEQDGEICVFFGEDEQLISKKAQEQEEQGNKVVIREVSVRVTKAAYPPKSAEKYQRYNQPTITQETRYAVIVH